MIGILRKLRGASLIHPHVQRLDVVHASIFESLEGRTLFTTIDVYDISGGEVTNDGTSAGIIASWSSDFHAGTTGSNPTVTLTLSDLPKHTHVDGDVSVWVAGGDEGDSKVLTMTIGAQQVFQDDMVSMTQEGLYLAEGNASLMMDRSDTLTITFAATGLSQYDQAPIREVHVSVFKPDVSISTVKGDATEADDPTMTFRVSRDGPVDDSLDVQIGDVTGTATQGSDYTPFPGSVSIPVGQPYADFNLSVIDDPDDEGDETVIVALANPPTAPYTANPAATTQAVIHDNTSVQRIVVKKIPTPAGQPAEFNYFNGYLFYDEVDVYGENLTNVEFTQTVNASTTITDEQTGQPLTQQQARNEFQNVPGIDLNLVSTLGQTVTDTNWGWQGLDIHYEYPVTGGQIRYGARGDTQGLSMGATSAGNGNFYAPIFTVDRTFTVMTRNKTTGAALMNHEWHYKWSNAALQWAAAQNPPVPFCALGTIAMTEKGVFSDVRGIDGLQ